MKIRNRALFNLGLCFLAFAVLTVLAGCSAPTFLTDLEAIVPIASGAVGSILALIGTFAGQPELIAVSSAITAVAAKAEADMKVLESAIAAYKANPSDTVLQDIEAAINSAQGSLSAILQVNGLPTQQATSIAALVAAINQQLQALLSVLPVFNSQTAGQQLSVTKPISAAAFKAQIDAITAPAS